jgi:hypothetical protein
VSLALQNAITTQVDVYSEALDKLFLPVEEDAAAQIARMELREAIELARCLRRLLDGRSLSEIHRAFGAPGDFGYGRPIGAALDKIYRGTK